MDEPYIFLFIGEVIPFWNNHILFDVLKRLYPAEILRLRKIDLSKIPSQFVTEIRGVQNRHPYFNNEGEF